MIDELGGPSHVAEMTGRKGFIGRYTKESVPTYIVRNTGNSTETDSFNVKEVCYDLFFFLNIPSVRPSWCSPVRLHLKDSRSLCIQL